jgi:hypothetical protein
VGADPVQGAVGVTENTPNHSSGYGHPETVVIPFSVSLALNQPSTDLVTDAGAAVYVSGARVAIGPVFV